LQGWEARLRSIVTPPRANVTPFVRRRLEAAQ
jgi:hypothetical protein